MHFFAFLIFSLRLLCQIRYFISRHSPLFPSLLCFFVVTLLFLFPIFVFVIVLFACCYGCCTFSLLLFFYCCTYAALSIPCNIQPSHTNGLALHRAPWRIRNILIQFGYKAFQYHSNLQPLGFLQVQFVSSEAARAIYRKVPHRKGDSV